MNAIFIVNGADVTDATLLDATRLNYDSARRITTGSITLMGMSPAKIARYDYATYDESYYALDLRELYPITILDGRDGVTKLFDGYIMSIDMKQTDGETPETFFVCDINDHAAWLDRSVCWDATYSVPMPCSDQELIRRLVAHFCPNVNSDVHIGMILPTIMAYDWLGKSCRQVLDDICALTLGVWRVDFDGYVWYDRAENAPPAPYSLSTKHDDVTSFPVRVDSWKSDFSNPINRCFVRGAIDAETGVTPEGEYEDPISIDTYGEFAASLVEDSFTSAYDCELRAKTTVLKYAYPLQQGSFTVWKDGLKCGMRVSIYEDALGIDDEYTITSLTLQWKDPYLVEYKANFGSFKPDLETYLRELDQRTKWKTSKPTAGVPIPGSVTDDSISSDGLHAESISSINGQVIQSGTIQAVSIGSVNGNTILTGSIQAGSIGSVNGATILPGSVQAGSIGSINAGTITIGKLSHSQIGSIDASTITVGVIISDQLANKIIDDLAKYADALRPVRMVKNGDPWPPTMPNDNYPPNSYFWYEPNGHFYKIRPDGLYWDDVGVNPDALSGTMSFFHIGALSAKNITGAIIAGQIESVTAGQITGSIESHQIGSIKASAITVGQIQSGQIGSVAASSISVGQIASTQIASVAASTITVGQIQANQIASITADKISTTIQGSQIQNIQATTITIGQIGDSQIADLRGTKIQTGTIDASKLVTTELAVGGGFNKPGKINVYDSGSASVAEIGAITGGYYGGWFKVFGAGGSGYSSAKVYTNTAGNLYIRDADFQISGGGYNVRSNTTTFDSSYSSIAWIVEGAGQSASHISRGMVLYEGGSKIGYLGRAPGGGWAELDLGSGAAYVNIANGVVRADSGFKVGGSSGYSTAIQVTATNGQQVTLTWTKGILTNATIP